MSEHRATKEVVADPASELQALLDAAVDGIVTISQQGTIVGFNRAAERMFGYSADEAVGSGVEMLMPEPYRAGHAGFVNSYLDHGEKKVIGTGREVIGRRKDGSTFPMWISVGEATTLNDGHRFVGIIHDLTEARKADRERRELEAHLAHVGRLSLLGEMAAGIAHEINQPLSAIATYAQAGKRVMACDEPDLMALKETCEHINEQAHRAGQVMQNLRGLLKQQDVLKEPIDLNAAFESIVPLIEADARATGIAFTVHFAKDLPLVDGNAVQLQQVILNLTRNAIDAMKSSLHRDKGLILSTGTPDSSHVSVTVTDHGPGVAKRLGDAIFHPFVTTKREGLGIGLAISKTIVEAHAGRLSYRPNPDGGSIFEVLLPLSGSRH